MFNTTDHTTMEVGNSRMPRGSEALSITVKTEKTHVFFALRLTVVAMLFVVASFFSFGADVSVANAKTAAKGKTTKTIKAKAKTTVKAKALKAKATKAKVKALKAKATKAKLAKNKAIAKAKLVAARVKTRAVKANSLARASAKSTVKTLGGQWGLLNQYKRDLAAYGKQKLEGWTKKMAGTASWYGTFFHGRLTASGRRFNKYADIAAHRSLPFGTVLKVTNKDNGKTAIVEVLDRGPYVHDRLIDLSHGTATKLGFMGTGTANVETEILRIGDLDYKVEAPLTAAELRGDVIRHRIDLAGIDLNAKKTSSMGDLALGALRLGGLLPKLKPDMDAFDNIVDSAQLSALEASMA